MTFLLVSHIACLTNIDIYGDHQMTVKLISTFYSVIETQKGFIFTIWHNYAHVPEQAKSIYSRFSYKIVALLSMITLLPFEENNTSI